MTARVALLAKPSQTKVLRGFFVCGSGAGVGVGDSNGELLSADTN